MGPIVNGISVRVHVAYGNSGMEIGGGGHEIDGSAGQRRRRGGGTVCDIWGSCAPPDPSRWESCVFITSDLLGKGELLEKLFWPNSKSMDGKGKLLKMFL